MERAYRSHVDAQCLRNPCLTYLHDFLYKPKPHRGRCRVIDFSAWGSNQGCRSMEVGELAEILRCNSTNHQQKLPKTKKNDTGSLLEKESNRLLIVENITPDIVELLGFALEIDPAFFASHVDTPEISFDAQTPDAVLLPSQRKSRQYLNVHYHQAFIFDRPRDSLPKTVLLDCNVDRKLGFPSSDKRRTIALARRVVSVLQLPPDSQWKGLILTDPAVTDKFYHLDSSKNMLSQEILGEPHLWLGGYEDFSDPSSPQIPNFAKPPHRNNLMDDIIYYWMRQTPPELNLDKHLLLYLCYYPLKIVTGEWMIYTIVMDRTIKQYEYSSKDLSDFHKTLNKLDSDIKALQSWRRRVKNSQQRIKALSTFLSAFSCMEADILREDFEYISALIEDCGRILETTIPLVASFVQIVDSRRAFIETTNVTRLTVLALVFLPPAYVSSLFSMNDANAPGGHLFWVYFAVAVPVTLVVFLIARPPRKDTLARLRTKTWQRRKRIDNEKDASQATENTRTDLRS